VAIKKEAKKNAIFGDLPHLLDGSVEYD